MGVQGLVCSHIMFPCSIETSTFSFSPRTLVHPSPTLTTPPSFCRVFVWSWHTSKLVDWQGRQLKAPIHLAGGIRLPSLSRTTSESSSRLFKYLASAWHPAKREKEGLKLSARRSCLKRIRGCDGGAVWVQIAKIFPCWFVNGWWMSTEDFSLRRLWCEGMWIKRMKEVQWKQMKIEGQTEWQNRKSCGITCRTEVCVPDWLTDC